MPGAQAKAVCMSVRSAIFSGLPSQADIPFWARKCPVTDGAKMIVGDICLFACQPRIWDRDNDTAYRSNSWQGAVVRVSVPCVLIVIPII